MPQLNGENNVLLTDDIIAKEALRLLKNNLVYCRLVHRNYEKEYGNVGTTINIKLPFRTKTTSGRTLGIQPMADKTIPLKIDRQENWGLQFDQNERTLSISEFSSRYLNSGMVAMAHKIDQDIADKMAKGFFFHSGTPGLALNTDAFADAYAQMTMVGVPMDNMCHAVMSPLDGAEISKDVKKLFHEGMVQDAVKKHWVGDLSDMDSWQTAQQPVHLVGNHGGTPLVAGAGQTGAVLATDGWTAGTAGLLNEGDLFTIAGVFEINPQTYASTGKLQGFVVTSVAASDGAGLSSVNISPAINDGTLTTLDAEGNNVSLAAYQNVTNAPADNAAITVVGTAGSQYRQATLFHRDSFAFAMINKKLPESAVVKQRVRDPITGLALSMTAAYDINEDRQIYRIDGLWGGQVVYPELGHRMFSK